MSTDLRAGSFPRCLLAIVLAGGGLVACTTSEARPDAGGGTGGGAATGTGGGTAAGGAGGGWVTNDGVPCPMPAMALITEFTYSADGGSMTSVRFGGDSTTLSGDQFVYPTGGSYPVMSNVTENNWHISGNIGDYSGFGLSFDNCSRVNASAYRGISFTISGTVAMGSMITMGSATLNNRIAASWLIAHPVAGSTPTAADPGRCIPNAAAVNQYAQSDCVDATKVIQVTTSPVTQNILWTDFTGGKPEANVTPTDITTVYWFFPPPVGAGSTNPTPYMADIRIDDLKFIQ